MAEPDRGQAASVTDDHTADEARIALHYRTKFAGPSMGTEEELSNTRIAMPVKASNMAGLVRYKASGEVLVLITRDIEVSKLSDTHADYAVELRTTPAELRIVSPKVGELDAWELRRRALQIAIWGIENRKGKALAADEYGGFQTEITVTDQLVSAVPPGGITEAGKQSTVGVPASAIGVGITAAQRAYGTVHPLLTLPWYKGRFALDPAASGFSEREKIGYALVMSAVFHLADIWTRYPGGLNRLEAKNEWLVRPRTAPVTIIDTFEVEHVQPAMAAVHAAKLPGWASEEVSAKTLNLMTASWGYARDHILLGRPMGGHPPPASTINGAPAMLFEYRTAPSDLPYAFWLNGELTPSDFG